MVIRIVYDGPPFSGKTTTLRALGTGVGRLVETPEERDGRTLFFDWLDYTAGSFEGHPIRCQIVSVPGQRSLAERRRRILAEADAVVFVADTGRLGMELSLKYAADLASSIAHLPAPRPAIVVQANKRDAPDANGIAEVEHAFRAVGVTGAFVETTASTGGGVREAFLYGVRLALDRVRELARLGALPEQRPDVDSSLDLLQRLATTENPGPTEGGNLNVVPDASTEPAELAGPDESAEPAEPAVPAVPAGEPDASPLPNATIPSGLIWPPVDGRLYLQQALVERATAAQFDAIPDVEPDRSSGWSMHSRPQDVFDSQQDGRSALTSWARLHARNGEFLSGRRCLVLSPSGARWRLWQILAKRPSLLDDLNQHVATRSARELAARILGAASALLSAGGFRRATMYLPATLATIGIENAKPVFVAMAPGFDVERGIAGRESSSAGEHDTLSQLSTWMLTSLMTETYREVVASLQERRPEMRNFGDMGHRLSLLLPTSTEAAR